MLLFAVFVLLKEQGLWNLEQNYARRAYSPHISGMPSSRQSTAMLSSANVQGLAASFIPGGGAPPPLIHHSIQRMSAVEYLRRGKLPLSSEMRLCNTCSCQKYYHEVAKLKWKKKVYRLQAIKRKSSRRKIVKKSHLGFSEVHIQPCYIAWNWNAEVKPYKICSKTRTGLGNARNATIASNFHKHILCTITNGITFISTEQCKNAKCLVNGGGHSLLL